MSLPYRHNFTWNINELLSLQREYELLEMTIQEIADKHERTVVAILYRLKQEDFIESWIDARGYQEYSKTLSYLVEDYGMNTYDYQEDASEDDDYVKEDYIETLDDEQEDEEEEDDDGISSLNQRVWGLETAVSDIKNMISALLSKFSSSTSSKPLKKLRQSQTQNHI